ncbi:hypothetical protein [Pseudomonas coleopterorum]|uniref:hypothetical protein n=1 Tax=Pseudomonas coleopterorum TaxID=1605838 RepID=UPI00177CBF97|nr:hypothetical protein [Pseudomonas coleopterorum]MBD8483480.1 hypothetical protein [Pseudomonas coleopterorum]
MSQRVADDLLHPLHDSLCDLQRDHPAIDISSGLVHGLHRVFPSAVAFFLWNYGAKHVDSGIAGQSLNLTVPFIAVMTLLAGGTVTSVDLIGGALVLFPEVLSNEATHKSPACCA